MEGLSVNEAGRLGGLAVLRKRGKAFYIVIGKQGQRAMREKYPDMASEWGKKCGRPRKRSFLEIMGVVKK